LRVRYRGSNGGFEDVMFRMAPINDFKCEAVTVDALDVDAPGRAG